MPKESEDTRLGKKIIDKCSSGFKKVWSYTYGFSWLPDDANLWINLILQPIDLIQYCTTKFGEWKKAKYNKKIAPYERVLSCMSANESSGLIEYLINQCDNLSYKSQSGKSFLIQAAECNRMDLMEGFLKNKIIKSTINDQDEDGNTALFYAIKNQMPKEQLMSFIENGAKLDITNKLCDTLFVQAVKDNNLEAAEALILVSKARSKSYIGKLYGWVKSKMFGVENNPIPVIDTPNKLGLTPLHIALQNKNPKMVDLLLRNNASTELKNGKKHAFSIFLDDVIKEYYKNANDQLKQKVFYNIVPAYEIIDLFQKSQPINSKPTDYLYTAITSYMYYPSTLGLDIITKLLNNLGKNIKEDDRGRNALHIAVGHAYSSLCSENALHQKLINKLIGIVGEKGKNLKDNSGYTPLDLAIENGNQEIAQLLRNHFCNGAKHIISVANSTYNVEEEITLEDQQELSLPSEATVLFRDNDDGTHSPQPPQQLSPKKVLGFDSFTTPHSTPSKRGTYTPSGQGTYTPSKLGAYTPSRQGGYICTPSRRAT